MSKVLYASDLDRTLIYSGRFLEEYPTEDKIEKAEGFEEGFISYISSDVKDKLKNLLINDDLYFVPVTTRTFEEYSRVCLGFTPKYAIVNNGGTVLKNNEPMEEYENYVMSKINPIEIQDIILDLDDYKDLITSKQRVLSNKFIFFKVDEENGEEMDTEMNAFLCKYPDYTYVRQVRKCYIIPKHFSKRIALDWLTKKLENPYVVASGDSQLDLPMLRYADKAVVPNHGALVKDGYIKDVTFVDGGITSPLKTISIVEELL